MAKASILLVSLSEDATFGHNYSHPLSALYARATLIDGTTATHCAGQLELGERPKAVLITNPNILHEDNKPLLAQIVKYAEAGGTVILCGRFAVEAKKDDVVSPQTHTQFDAELSSHA